MYSIRTYHSDDYRKLVTMWQKSGLKMTLSDIETEVGRFSEHNPDSFFVLTDAGNIIGSVIAAFDGRRGYIYHLAVDPNYQDKGLGRKLMDRADEYFNSISVVKAHLMVDSDNAEVVSFYEKMGWHLRDDIILMSKSLRTNDIEIMSDHVSIVD